MQRHNRLGSESLIRRVYATGARVRSKGVTVSGFVEGDAAPRVAIVASRKVGGAVVRNRARRRLRAAVDEALSNLKPGVVAVVAATADTPTLDFHKLADSVCRSLSKADLMRSAGA